MSRKKEHHEEHISEAWLIPYADLLTLLLALFIVLFASSQVDAEKFSAMKEAFGGIFAGTDGVIGEGGIGIDGTDIGTGQTGQQTEYTAPPTEPTTTPSSSGNGSGDGIPLSQRLEELQAKFDQYISQHALTGKLQTEISNETVMIIISDVVLFDSGSASIKPGFEETIYAIGNILAENPDLEVQIQGHTDNVPINTSTFATNWDLSSARALNFMKILLKDGRLDPAHYSAIGLGEYRPIASNDTDQGKALNRRVEVTARFYR